MGPGKEIHTVHTKASFVPGAVFRLRCGVFQQRAEPDRNDKRSGQQRDKSVRLHPGRPGASGGNSRSNAIQPRNVRPFI